MNHIRGNTSDVAIAEKWHVCEGEFATCEFYRPEACDVGVCYLDDLADETYNVGMCYDETYGESEEAT